MNKNFCLSALIASVALLTSFCTNHKSAVTMHPNQTINDSGFAVVELFTSEGCSSCPSADKAVEELAKQYPGNVYVLSFHVDYWNRLGWKDEFSKAEYTQRQSNYASQFNLQSIYTPQVVINGKHEFVGSDKAKLQSFTTNELKKPSSNKIDLTAEAKANGVINVEYNFSTNTKAQLHIALVQNEATTDVKRGENGGRKLHHINIVREMKTVSSSKGNVELKIPDDLTAADVKIIAYLQERNGAITAVQSKTVS